MSQPRTEEILEVCGKVGEILLNAGAETSRIETTVEYIGHAAGASVACYATITAVFVSLENESRTRLIKSTLGGFNLQKVDELNQLSREFVAHRITFEALKQEVARIDHQVINFPWWARILGAGWVSVAPILLFKATNGDLVLAFFVGIFGYLAAEYVGRRTTTPYFKEATGAFVVAILAELLVSIGWGDSSGNIIISALMPLVPGVAITNAIREILSRQIISGIVRTVDAIFVAGAIGSGVVIAIVLNNVWGGR